MLMDIYAKYDALVIFASRSHGAGIEFHRIQNGEGVSWHPASGPARRATERVIDKATASGFLTAKGGRTASRRLALTIAGTWRAEAFLSGSLLKTMAMIGDVWNIGALEAGTDTVDPSGMVPTFRLDDHCGAWWGAGSAGICGVQDVYSRLLPAVLCGWVELSFQGNRGQAWHWWRITDEGRDACKRYAEDDGDMIKLDRLVKTISAKTTIPIGDRYIEQRRHEYASARELKGDNSDVGMIPFPASRWWSPKKAGEA